MSGYASELAQRREEYLAWVLDAFRALEPEMAPTDGRRWALNHARLLRGEELDPANRYFASIALTQDADIFFIRHLQTLLDFRDSPRLDAAARERLTSLLAAWPHNELSSLARWPCIHTENHQLMQLTIGMFARQARGEDIEGHVEAIHQVLTWRFERGWVEWNSPCYQVHFVNPLMVLIAHAPSPALRKKASDLLNVLLAERALLGVNGYLGGPAFRCRTADVYHSPTARKVAYLEDNRYDGLLPTVWLAFGLGEPRFDFATARVPDLEPAGEHYASGNEPRLKQDEGMMFAGSAWEPHPVVVALAQEALTRPHLIYEGQRFIGWPDDEGWATQRWFPARLTYYNTPHVSLASVHSDGWICQSRYCNVMFGADPSQNLRVAIILPDVTPTKRRHESRGRVVQHQSWLLAQGTLFEDGGVKAHRVGEWDIYRVGQGLCARYALPDDYHVLQVGDLDQFASAEAFVQALTIPRMNGHEVHGVSREGDRLVVDTRDMSLTVNGETRPHPPTMLHDCPYMTSEYGSGKITITTEAGSVTFDGTTAGEAR
jgi:hypothetical protein